MTSMRALTVGTDGSPESMNAADWAAREAVRRALPLRLLYAGSGERSVPAPPGPGLLDRAARQLSYAHPALEVLAVRKGARPVAALLEAAGESETLVLGSRGSTGYSGFLVGSVALAVSARAERPVVLVRAGGPPQDEQAPDAPDFPPVVVGLDVAEPADEVLSYAFEAAALRGTELHAVHAWSVPPPRGGASGVTTPAGDAARRETLSADALTAALQVWRAKYPDVPVVPRLVYGRPGHHLLKASASAGLTVLGRGMDQNRLGRTAHSVVHHATGPVAVVPYT
ncbi:universal stress protein [Streptomyces sp. NPDC006552]|uniref:universal stress protein n=1 Tax=Streptomyces sp. NPDC006552 TaxID=3157179 RepID=UPI0033B5F1CC